MDYKKHPNINTINLFDKKILFEYLNDILINSSPRNRINYRADLSSMIQVMEHNEIMRLNFIKRIPVLKSIPQRNKIYTDDQQEEIFSYLKKKDPILYLFIK